MCYIYQLASRLQTGTWKFLRQKNGAWSPSAAPPPGGGGGGLLHAGFSFFILFPGFPLTGRALLVRRYFTLYQRHPSCQKSDTSCFRLTDAVSEEKLTSAWVSPSPRHLLLPFTSTATPRHGPARRHFSETMTASAPPGGWLKERFFFSLEPSNELISSQSSRHYWRWLLAPSSHPSGKQSFQSVFRKVEAKLGRQFEEPSVQQRWWLPLFRRGF